jgi:hypothetical protein
MEDLNMDTLKLNGTEIPQNYILGTIEKLEAEGSHTLLTICVRSLFPIGYHENMDEVEKSEAKLELHEVDKYNRKINELHLGHIKLVK